jgi:hypothetical protein
VDDVLNDRQIGKHLLMLTESFLIGSLKSKFSRIYNKFKDIEMFNNAMDLLVNYKIIHPIQKCQQGDPQVVFIINNLAEIKDFSNFKENSDPSPPPKESFRYYINVKERFRIYHFMCKRKYSSHNFTFSCSR